VPPHAASRTNGTILRIAIRCRVRRQLRPDRCPWSSRPGVGRTLELALGHAQAYTIGQPRFSLGWLNYVNVLGRLDRAAQARAALEQSLATNPLMTPAYYAGLMAVLSDQPSIIDSRTAGLKQAGLL